MVTHNDIMHAIDVKCSAMLNMKEQDKVAVKYLFEKLPDNTIDIDLDCDTDCDDIVVTFNHTDVDVVSEITRIGTNAIIVSSQSGMQSHIEDLCTGEAIEICEGLINRGLIK